MSCNRLKLAEFGGYVMLNSLLTLEEGEFREVEGDDCYEQACNG